MEESDVRRLAFISAVNAEVEGMKALNKQRELQGESIAYNEDMFQEKANELKYIGQLANHQILDY